MFLGEPPPTRYDLHFSIAGIPIRVHPLFWALALILGLATTGPERTATLILIWMLVVFVSITIHELGHAFAYRRYGMSSHIVLHHFGGVAVADSLESFAGWGVKMTPARRMFISFAGPGSQFVVVLLIILLLMASGSRLPYALPDFIVKILPPSVHPVPGFWLGNPHLNFLVWSMLVINFYWAVFNLLPIFPLDGGQIAREMFTQFGRGDAIRPTLILSIVVAGLGVLYQLNTNNRYMVMMFLMLGIQNFMTLQQFYGRGGFGGGGFGGGGGGGGGYGGGRRW